MVSVSKHCWNLHHCTFIIFLDHCWVNWVGTSLLLTCQSLGLLVNTLAANEKYSVFNRDNLTIAIQIQLSQKKKSFAQFVAWLFKNAINFKYFEKNDDPHRFCNFEITDSQNVVRSMSKKSCFRGLFDNHHGKRAEALLKAASQHL